MKYDHKERPPKFMRSKLKLLMCFSYKRKKLRLGLFKKKIKKKLVNTQLTQKITKAQRTKASINQWYQKRETTLGEKSGIF